MLDYLSQPLRIVEILATITGFWCVYLNTQEKILAWPIGIISVGLSAWVFWENMLLSDMLLHVIYVILGFYGWYVWAFGGTNKQTLSVSKFTTSRQWVTGIGIGFLGMLGLGYFFDTYTAADLAYWDAYTTSFSLVAQVLLARKKLENWLFWIAVDIIAIGIYAVKGLPFFSFLYIGYLGLAIWGYLSWKKRMEEESVGLIDEIGQSREKGI